MWFNFLILFLDLSSSDPTILRALSIKTLYADKIRERSKLWELRTYSVNVPPGGWIALYESRPTQAIQTIIQIGRIFKLHPDDAWQQYEDQLGIEFENFFCYFRKRKFAYGMEIQDVRSFDPVSLATLRRESDFVIPQMCMPLKSIHKRILAEWMKP